MTLPVCFSLNVNDAVASVEASPETPLLYILRNDLSLNGPKYGCGLGECGACAVLVDGRAVRSCTVPLGAVGARRVTTLEGLGTPEHLHPVQAAFIDEAAAQCGYCLNGMIIATASLLNRNVDPNEEDIREALRHHLCRCGTHMEILAAARRAVGYAKAERARRPMPDPVTLDAVKEVSP
ncbi:MAG: (2Fe-2S)-binding protein [Rhizobium sp.]|uniref:(2Fe-2S)-binding protein n=1 Tax=Rhizobium sp. TaxID=391 RepID=UPI000B224584